MGGACGGFSVGGGDCSVDFRVGFKISQVRPVSGGYIAVILGLYWGYIGIMESKMETTIVYWGYNGLYSSFPHHKRQHLAGSSYACTARAKARERERERE